ncbi:hypothetical protein DFP72DRAFT_532967 [Ephemerocybe angulata]|uniref:Uncharacterized protein n=1 Tax=Ephemerocybe angulata TaxID=980116 RepID=A0A8H6HNV2_9AGAR|nr:hypothetical protein DFP72DRAFT_532967 [Tulosesus angulatus]
MSSDWSRTRALWLWLKRCQLKHSPRAFSTSLHTRKARPLPRTKRRNLSRVLYVPYASLKSRDCKLEAASQPFCVPPPHSDCTSGRTFFLPTVFSRTTTTRCASYIRELHSSRFYSPGGFCSTYSYFFGVSCTSSILPSLLTIPLTPRALTHTCVL